MFTSLFSTRTPVLMAVPTHTGAVRTLLAGRGETSRFHVIGYREPDRPTTPEGLLDHCGLSAATLAAQATIMLKEHRP
ncbi:hypothetical protein BJF79_47410 [Actinomadura sp. CNU-125]|nr:hypothetical protein BJF79_47410 [Actinomadura sp. CNU-125]